MSEFIQVYGMIALGGLGGFAIGWTAGMCAANIRILRRIRDLRRVMEDK